MVLLKESRPIVLAFIRLLSLLSSFYQIHFQQQTMKINNLFFLFTLVIVTLARGDECLIQPPYTGLSVVKLTFSDVESREKILSDLSEICEIKAVQDEYTDPNADSVELILTQEQLIRAEKLLPSRSIRVLMGDLGAAISHERETSLVSPAESEGFCTDDTCSSDSLVAGTVDTEYYTKYHSYEDFLQRWETLASTYSDYVKLETIGSTLEGRKIHMFRVGQTSEEKPIRILFNAMQHAREWITTMCVLHTVETLAADAHRKKAWSSNVQILVVPIVNPDGFVYSHATDRMWRKNRNPARSCRGGPAGVDLNRNWGLDFAGCESTSSDPCSDIYTGPEAFSELETQALKKLFETEKGLKAHIDVHSFSQLVLGRWSYSDDPPPNMEEVNKLGNLLNEKLSSGGKQYSYARGKTDLIYLASGVMPDWVYDAHNVMSFTYELRPKSMWEGGFMLPANQIIPSAEEFLESVKALIDYVTE